MSEPQRTERDEVWVTFVLSDGAVMKMAIHREQLRVRSFRMVKQRSRPYTLNISDKWAGDELETDNYDFIETRGADGTTHWIALPQKYQKEAR